MIIVLLFGQEIIWLKGMNLLAGTLLMMNFMEQVKQPYNLLSMMDLALELALVMELVVLVMELVVLVMELTLLLLLVLTIICRVCY